LASNIAKSESNGVIVETGAGASTIMLSYFAFKYDKVLYTWDLNQNKLSYLRSIIVDTHERLFGKSVHQIWKYIPFFSTSKELGIPILQDIDGGLTVDFGFFDSEHTRNVLLAELDATLEFVSDGCVIALDDANYNFVYQNTAYINIFRKKLGLPKVETPDDNLTKPFYEEAEAFIKKTYPKTVKLDDTYKTQFRDDIFWSYFSNDRNIMGKMDMEKLNALEHRYDSFKIYY